MGRSHRGGAGNPLERLGTVAWQALMLMGLAAIAIGVVALVWPGRTLLVLGVLFGIYLLISGVMEIVAAFGAFVSAGMRALLIVSGALSIMLGVLCFRNSLHNSVLPPSLWIGIIVISWPIGSIVTLAVFTGAWLIAVGLAEVIHAFSLRSLVRSAGGHGRHATAVA
ncbi:HdeD family acid-resistance protein [Streptomyces sp. NPDC059063]|uniref:HdeD family acid-resistance protein n=1 Tax=unclassified Streptomyces TaxID=2593676 RepID=UPI0036BE448A